jgi:hypothetical protein
MRGWNEKIELADVFHNDDLSFTERRDIIVARIKRSRWYHQADIDNGDLLDIVDALADSDTEDEFDGSWDELYDLADEDRVWVGAAF